MLTPGKVEEGGYILAPFFRGISVDLNFTFTLALISVIFIQVIGVHNYKSKYLVMFVKRPRKSIQNR